PTRPLAGVSGRAQAARPDALVSPSAANAMAAKTWERAPERGRRGDVQNVRSVQSVRSRWQDAWASDMRTSRMRWSRRTERAGERAKTPYGPVCPAVEPSHARATPRRH